MTFWEKHKTWLVAGSIFLLLAVIVACILAFVVFPPKPANKTENHSANDQNPNDKNANNDNTGNTTNNVSSSTPVTIPAKDLLQPGTIIHTLATEPSTSTFSLMVSTTKSEDTKSEKEQNQVTEKAQQLLQTQNPAELIVSPRRRNSVSEEQSSESPTIQIYDHLIQSVIIIKLKDNVAAEQSVIDKLDQLQLPATVNWYQLKPQEKSSHQLSHYMAHLSALSHAKKQASLQHSLLVQDNVAPFIRAETLRAFLFYADKCLGGRWDVISFVPASTGEFLQTLPVAYGDENYENKTNHKKNPTILTMLPSAGLFRITEPKDTRTCYLINRNYIHTMFHHMWETLRIISKATHTQATTQSQILDEVFNMNKPMFELQKRDCWLAFTVPLTSEQQLFYPVTRVNFLSPHKPYRVAMTFFLFAESSETATKMVAQLSDTCYQFYLKFLKLHMVDLFIFTNYPDVVKTMNQQSSLSEHLTRYEIHITQPEWVKDPALYRFHILSMISSQLQHYDYIFHTPYHHIMIVNPPDPNELLLEDGVVITEYPPTTMQDQKVMVERREDSFACILPDEQISHRFSNGFMGGKAVPMLHVWDVLTSMINSDVNANVVGINKDESYLQRYFMDHPPNNILSPAYQFFSSCFDPRNPSALCDALRHANVKPVIVPLN